MKVWLDDERSAPAGWVHVKTPWEAIELVKTGQVEEISLDNDLGFENYVPPNEGHHVAEFIERGAVLGELKFIRCRIHTQNVAAKDRMKAAIRNAYKAWGFLADANREDGMTEPKKPMTDAQRARQGHRDHGRYAQVHPCYGCGKSAGVDYCSHPMTDCTDPDGKDWGDTAICLCLKCAKATEHMTRVTEFIEYAKAHGGMK